MYICENLHLNLIFFVASELQERFETLRQSEHDLATKAAECARLSEAARTCDRDVTSLQRLVDDVSESQPSLLPSRVMTLLRMQALTLKHTVCVRQY